MDLIKCDKCGQVLMNGYGCTMFFSAGAELGCENCGNKYVFLEDTTVGEQPNPPKETISNYNFITKNE